MVLPCLLRANSRISVKIYDDEILTLPKHHKKPTFVNQAAQVCLFTSAITITNTITITITDTIHKYTTYELKSDCNLMTHFYI